MTTIKTGKYPNNNFSHQRSVPKVKQQWDTFINSLFFEFDFPITINATSADKFSSKFLLNNLQSWIGGPE